MQYSYTETVTLVRAFRNNPEFSQNFQLRNHIPKSIVNLRELKYLSLSSSGIPKGESFISDVAFQFAFLQMPKLKTLSLSDDFKASAEMACVWRDGGRILRD